MAEICGVLLLLLHEYWGSSMHWAGHTLLGAPLRTAVDRGEGRLEHIIQEINADILLLARGRTGTAVENSSESEEDRNGVAVVTSGTEAEEVGAYCVSFFSVCCGQHEHMIKEAAELEQKLELAWCTWCGLNVCYEDGPCYRYFQSLLLRTACDPDPALDAASDLFCEDKHGCIDGSVCKNGGSIDDMLFVHSYYNDVFCGGTATMAHNSSGQLNVSGTRVACDPDPALVSASDPVGEDEQGHRQCPLGWEFC